MLNHQKNKFRIPDQITYLNGAYMSPFLKSVEKIGHQAVTQKCFPYQIGAADFFTHSEKLRNSFARFIEAPDPDNIAIIPSVSYGMANVAKNIKLNPGDEILLIDEQFPSNVYAWQKVAQKNQAIIKIIKPPKDFKSRGKRWNKNILDAIDKKTAVVAMGPLHWADGTLFNLQAISAKTKENKALMIIDGSQAVGAMKFSIKELQPDALVVVGYKWLLGPYSIGFAYYSDAFNKGEPIEESWINRADSENFASLVNYENNYQPKAQRYNVGEYSNFILTPMMQQSLDQIAKWGPDQIQQYCHYISQNAIEALRKCGCFIEDDAYRAKHLFGVYLPKKIDLVKLKSNFKENNVFVSFRGQAIRVSCNVYNNKSDFDKLVHCFKGV